MKNKVIKNLIMITSIISGLGMNYARWNDNSSLVVDVWNTIFIVSVSFSAFAKDNSDIGNKEKGRNNTYIAWCIGITLLLASYIGITIFRSLNS